MECRKCFTGSTKIGIRVTVIDFFLSEGETRKLAHNATLQLNFALSVPLINR